MSTVQNVPRIGVGVFVVNSRGLFLMGLRKGSHGTGTWALPGGHLEVHESFETCAQRETLEETGLDIKEIQFLTATNSPYIDGDKHYVTIFVTARVVDDSKEPQLLEPEKCAEWKWVKWNEFHDMYVQDKKHGDKATVRLFQPMLDIIEQRPGSKPDVLM